MKILFSKFLMLFFLLAFSTAHSEIYSWIDKEGKKHFGEKVPKEYIKQSNAVEIKSVNGMQATSVSGTPQQQTNTQTDPVVVPPPQEDEEELSQNLSKCEQQKKAYDKSVRCFSKCQLGSGYVNNVSACDNCPDLKKPDC